MANTHTLAEAEAYIDRALTPRQILRKELEHKIFSGVEGVNIWMVSPNYSCLDTFGPNQRVVVEGASVNVWSSRNGLISVSASIHSSIDLRATVARLIAEAEAMCPHDRTRQLSWVECEERGIRHYGNHYHVYECLDCHNIQGVDSSG